MRGLKVDDYEIKQWQDDIQRAAEVMPKVAQQIVAKGALNIKNDARKRVRGFRHAPAYPFSITYDTYTRGLTSSAEIGPDKRKRQGALGNILEYGSPTSSPHPHMRPAAELEEPRFEKALLDAAEQAVEGR